MTTPTHAEKIERIIALAYRGPFPCNDITLAEVAERERLREANKRRSLNATERRRLRELAKR